MKSYLSLLLTLSILNAGCDREQDVVIPTLPTVQDAPKPSPPKTEERANLEISNVSIDGDGYLQATVHNLNSVPLEIINMCWYFFRQDGSQIMSNGYPKIVLTEAKESRSQIINAGQSKTFNNPLITVAESIGEPINNIYVELKIYIWRTDFENLGLKSTIECNEEKLRQIFQSARIRLRKVSENTMDPSAKETRYASLPGTPSDEQNNKTFRLPQSKEEEVYKFMKTRWEALADSASGYDPDKHDNLVALEAAKIFGISRKEALAIYIRQDAK